MILTLGSDKQEEDGNVNQPKGNNTMKKAKGKTRMMGGGKAKKLYARGGVTKMKAGKAVKGKKRGGKR